MSLWEWDWEVVAVGDRGSKEERRDMTYERMGKVLGLGFMVELEYELIRYQIGNRSKSQSQNVMLIDC